MKLRKRVLPLHRKEMRDTLLKDPEPRGYHDIRALRLGDVHRIMAGGDAHSFLVEVDSARGR